MTRAFFGKILSLVIQLRVYRKYLEDWEVMNSSLRFLFRGRQGGLLLNSFFPRCSTSPVQIPATEEPRIGNYRLHINSALSSNKTPIRPRPAMTLRALSILRRRYLPTAVELSHIIYYEVIPIEPFS